MYFDHGNCDRCGNYLRVATGILLPVEVTHFWPEIHDADGQRVLVTVPARVCQNEKVSLCLWCCGSMLGQYVSVAVGATVDPDVPAELERVYRENIGGSNED